MIWGPGKLLHIHISNNESEKMIELEAELIVGKGY